MSQLIKEWIEKRRDNRFPNVVKVAHFSPRAQLVTLDAYAKGDLPKAMLANDHDRASEILATISHELTHWADVVGTVWGRGHMQRIYEAYRLATNRNRPGSEADFPRLIELYDEERRLSFPTYYQVVEENQTPHGHNHPWIIGFSAGQEIDPHGRLDPARPILFVRFFDHDTKRLLIRQPITVGALLETIAVASEYMEIYTYIEAKIPNDQKVVTRETTRRAFLSRLYTPELTLYSAPAHLFAHYARVRDAAAAYEHAARIAHLCLNLTDAHFYGLLLPEEMAPWAKLFPAFKQQRDRGFAFAVICSNLQPWDDGRDAREWLDAALLASGLPDAATIMAEAIAVMSSDMQGRKDFPFDMTEDYMLELGIDVAKSRAGSPLFGPSYSLNALGLVPPSVDGEGELIEWPGSKFDFSRFDPEQMVTLDFSLEGYIRNLLKGCR